MQLKKITTTACLALICLFSLLATAKAEIINVTETATYTFGEDKDKNTDAAKEKVAQLATLQVIEVASVYVESVANTYDSILSDALIKATTAIYVQNNKTLDLKEPQLKDKDAQFTATANVNLDTEQIPRLIASLQDQSDFISKYNTILARYTKLQKESATLDKQQQTDKKDSAKDDLKKARQNNINAFLATIYLEQGLLAQNKQDNQAACDFYSKAIKVNPKDALAYSYRGDTAYVAEKYKDALKDYEKATKFAPEEQAYLNQKNTALAKLKQKDRD